MTMKKNIRVVKWLEKAVQLVVVAVHIVESKISLIIAAISTTATNMRTTTTTTTTPRIPVKYSTYKAL